jgi:hypothetical protein
MDEKKGGGPQKVLYAFFRTEVPLQEPGGWQRKGSLTPNDTAWHAEWHEDTRRMRIWNKRFPVGEKALITTVSESGLISWVLEGDMIVVTPRPGLKSA